MATVKRPLRHRIPTVHVRLVTDDGEVSFRARWKHSALKLQRRISFVMRQGKVLWFEDERGRTRCFRPECVWVAMVDGRSLPNGATPAPETGPPGR